MSIPYGNIIFFSVFPIVCHSLRDKINKINVSVSKYSVKSRGTTFKETEVLLPLKNDYKAT